MCGSCLGGFVFACSVVWLLPWVWLLVFVFELGDLCLGGCDVAFCFSVVVGLCFECVVAFVI